MGCGSLAKPLALDCDAMRQEMLFFYVARQRQFCHPVSQQQKKKNVTEQNKLLWERTDFTSWLVINWQSSKRKKICLKLETYSKLLSLLQSLTAPQSRDCKILKKACVCPIFVR